MISQDTKKLLTDYQIKHLKDHGVESDYDLHRTFFEQRIMRRFFDSEPCFECRSIAVALGIPVK